MRCMSFFGGMMLGAALGSAACVTMQPSRKAKCKLSKALRGVSDVIESVTDAMGW